MAEGPQIEIRVEANGLQPGRRYFVLDDDDRTVRQMPVVCEADFREWKSQTYGRHRVDRLLVCETPEIIVATHFQGHDDEPPDHPPRPWSTIIWGGPLHSQLCQYATLGEAKQGHWRAVDLVREAMKQRPSA